MVQKGKFSAGTESLVSKLNKVDFPAHYQMTWQKGSRLASRLRLGVTIFDRATKFLIVRTNIRQANNTHLEMVGDTAQQGTLNDGRSG